MDAELDGISILHRAPGAHVGLVVARGIRLDPSPGLDAALDDAIARAKATPPDEDIRTAVRGLLRFGRYKPTGRGKPASEYLQAAAREDRFPRINPVVDLNNLVSLDSGLPISLVDLARSGDALTLRRGRAGESYTFNGAGQVIELEDLLLVARGEDDAPLANPVKDSMAAKTDANTTDVLAVIYAPAGARLAEATERFRAGFLEYVGAARATAAILEG